MKVRRRWALLLPFLLALPLRAAADDDAPVARPPAQTAAAKKKEQERLKHIKLKDLAPSWTSDIYKPLPPALPDLTQAQLDKLYENAPGTSGDETPVHAPSGNLKPDFVISNGQIQSASLTYKPSGTRIEMGVLGGPDAPNSLIAPSPYLNLRQDFQSKPDSWVDYNIALQAAVVQMNARYFNDELSADPQTMALAGQLQALPSSIPGAGQNLSSMMSYNDGYQLTNLVVTSALAQVGRAYSLFGPVDFGWTAGALLKVTQFFPNAAGDLTLGPRVNLGDGRSVVASGGLTQNISPVGNDMIQQYLGGGQPTLGLNREAAPHAEVSYLGSIPGEEKINMDATAMRQWNSLTILDQMRAALGTDVGGKPTELGLTYKNENGPGIEYSRQSRMVDITRHFSNSIAGSVGYQMDNINYGNANLSNKAVTAGIKIDLGGGGKGGGEGTAEIKENFSPQYSMNGQSTGFGQVVSEINLGVSNVLNIAEQAQSSAGLPVSPNAGNPNADPQRMQAIASSISSLTPAQQEAYKLALLGAASNDPERQQEINQLFTGNNLQQAAAGLNQGASLLTLLSNEQVLENFVDILLRNRLIAFFDSIEFKIPVINSEVHWSPAVMIAAAQVLSSRPSPMAPMTMADEQNTLQPWAMKQIALGAGLPANATPQQIAAALLQSAPPSLQGQLQSNGVATVNALVAALSDEVRLQFNEMMIQVILAGEQLNRLTVDGGRQTGDLNHSMLRKEFANLDSRNGSLQPILEGAIARIRAELRQPAR